MQTKTALTFALLAALPALSFAQSSVTQIEEAALASQAATNAPDLKAAHALAGQALDGAARSPVSLVAPSSGGLPLQLKYPQAKAPLKNAGISQTPEQKADSGWKTFWGGAFWGGLGVLAMAHPITATIVGAIGAAGVFYKLSHHDATAPKDKLKVLAVAAVSCLALAAPPLGALAFLGLGAAMAVYGLAKIAAAAVKQDD